MKNVLNCIQTSQWFVLKFLRKTYSIVQYFEILLFAHSVNGVRAKFFRGGKVTLLIFPVSAKCFSLVENFHFGRPKTNFNCSKKWKAKKKKKKLSSTHFHTFSHPFFIFHLPFYNFPPVVLHFACLSFPSRSAKISRWKTSEGHSAPLPPSHPGC